MNDAMNLYAMECEGLLDTKESKINALIKDLRKEYIANGNYLPESKVIATFMAHDIDHSSLTCSEWNKIKKRIMS